MTSTWRVQHHAGAGSVVNTDEVAADFVETDDDNNLVLRDSAGVVAAYKRESWYSVVREKPQSVTVLLVPIVVGVNYAPTPAYFERHAELII